MHVGSLCTRDVVTIDAQRSVAEAAALMQERHVGALVITQPGADGDQVVGIVTDRDLVLCGMKAPDAGVLATVSPGARGPLAVLHEDDGLAEAVQAMRERGVRRLLVKDGEHRLAGVLSIDDVIGALADQLAGLAAAMRAGLALERSATTAPRAAGTEMRFPCFGTGTWSSAIGREDRS